MAEAVDLCNIPVHAFSVCSIKATLRLLLPLIEIIYFSWFGLLQCLQSIKGCA